jgi:ribosome-associated protein
MPDRDIEIGARDIVIRAQELEWRFIRASGPGGQKVNKVATAVQLRFDAARSPSLPEDARTRLLSLAGRRVSQEGVLVIDARRHRTQQQNREDAITRLIALLQRATEVRRPRRKTAPTAAAKARRLKAKRQRGDTKRQRAAPGDDH